MSKTFSTLLCLIGLMSSSSCMSTGSETSGAALHEIDEIHPYMKDGRNGRLEYLAKARVWSPTSGNLTPEQILQGQPQERYAMNEVVTCSFKTPGSLLNGATPKFECDRNGRTIRVKFAPDGDPNANREIFSEVAGSRLAWAMGLPSDSLYPVIIDCADCPADPRYPVSSTNAATGYRGPAAIEHKLAAPTIEPKTSEMDREGFTFSELDGLAGFQTGNVTAGRAEVDAMRLLASFVEHWDCKSDNQRMSCEPGSVVRDGGPAQRNESLPEDAEHEDDLEDTATMQHCGAPMAYIHDAGSWFGRDAVIFGAFYRKWDLQEWIEDGFIRTDAYGVCRLTLSGSARCPGGIGESTIGEAGRQLFVRRMNELMTDGRGQPSLDRVRAAFQAARPELLGDTAEQWAQAFAGKVAQVSSMTCRERPTVQVLETPDSVPADSELVIPVMLNDADGLDAMRVKVWLRRAGDMDNEYYADVSAGGTEQRLSVRIQVPRDAWGPYELIVSGRHKVTRQGFLGLTQEGGPDTNEFIRPIYVGPAN